MVDASIELPQQVPKVYLACCRLVSLHTRWGLPLSAQTEALDAASPALGNVQMAIIGDGNSTDPIELPCRCFLASQRCDESPVRREDCHPLILAIGDVQVPIPIRRSSAVTAV